MANISLYVNADILCMSSWNKTSCVNQAFPKVSYKTTKI